MARTCPIALALLALLLSACEREPVRLRGVPGASLPDYSKLLPAFQADFEKHDLAKADAATDYKNAHPEWFAITIPPKKAGFRAMREWEPMQSILLSISDGIANYGAVATTLAVIVRDAWPVGKVWLVYQAEAARAAFTTMLTAEGIPATSIGAGKAIEFVKSEVDAIWMIDFGPFPLVDDASNSYAFLDWKYYPSRYHDDAVPTRLGQLWGVTTYRQDFSFEGGNFQADGAGTCYTTERALENTGVSLAALQEQFEDYIGCTQLVVLRDLHDDGTGHIDMFFKLAAQGTAILGSFTAAQDPVSQADMNANEAILKAVALPGGAPMTVWRMPHPNASAGTPRTYLNSTLFNGRNLWPDYSDDKDIEADAVAVWQAAMPTWEHFPVNSDQIALWSGAVHCVTRTLPAASAAEWVADGTCSGSACTAPAGGYTGPCTTDAGCFGPQWMAYCVESGDCQDTCQGVSYEGCCDGQTVTWCENGVLKAVDCATSSAGLSCGWDATSQWYWCGTAGGADPSGANPRTCPTVCVPACDGKVCGDDGCGGTCGACPAGQACEAGQCACVPACDGKACGSDGCGGTCGACGAGLTCTGGQCACTPACLGRECGADGCGGSCGTCSASEVCTAGLCACVPACNGKACGGDGCGGVCGMCPAGQACAGGQCACVPACGGKACGDDGCGGSCGTCAAGQACSAAGQCACQPDCAWRTCGSDGCSGSCGTCDAGSACADGDCVCQPVCAGKACGDDGCGGSCGACDAGKSCTDAGACVAGPCTPDCAGKACGPDGCGGSCGACSDGNGCTADLCVAGACVFDATTKDDQLCPDDGLTCTTDRCAGGACTHVRASGCLIAGVCHANGDANPANACQRCDDQAPLAWTPRFDGSPCDDGDACTHGDTCHAGTCASGTPTVCAPLSACHKAGACDPATGTCTTPVLPDGTACDDGDAGTGNDRCNDGVCSGWPCGCSGTSACCDGCFATNEGGACSDQNPCTTGDTCGGGTCLPGAPVLCPAADACHVSGSCQPSTGLCSTPPAKDGLPCDDGDQATRADRCVNGMCVGEGCLCSGAGACCDGCQPKSEGLGCDDGSACTVGEVCDGGACLGGQPKPCETGSACLQPQGCAPQTGECLASPLPDGTPCDDGDEGTGGDACDGGTCAGAPCTCFAVDACCDGCFAWNDGGACDDGDLCTLDDACADGACAAGATVDCVDAPGDCRSPTGCDPGSGACHDAPEPDGTACVLGDDATGNCLGSVCVAEGCTCSAISACCDGCAPRNDGTACDDLSACTANDACAAGQCGGAPAVTCPAPEACQVAVACDPATGQCVATPAEPGSPCDDGDPLTNDDACTDEGRCEGAVLAPDVVEPAPDADVRADAEPPADEDRLNRDGSSGCSSAADSASSPLAIGLLGLGALIALSPRRRRNGRQA